MPKTTGYDLHEPTELFAAARTITSSDARALELITQPHPSFGGQSLADLARGGSLADALAYLESIASGFIG